MFVGLLNGRSERKRKKREKQERQREKELERRGDKVRKQPSFTLPARGNPYRISHKYRSQIHYRPMSGTWSAHQSWGQIPGSSSSTPSGPRTPVTPAANRIRSPCYGGFYALNDRISQNFDPEEISYWICKQRLRRVTLTLFVYLFRFRS